MFSPWYDHSGTRNPHILILSRHLCLGLASGLLHRWPAVTNLCAFMISIMCETRPVRSGLVALCITSYPLTQHVQSSAASLMQLPELYCVKSRTKHSLCFRYRLFLVSTYSPQQFLHKRRASVCLGACIFRKLALYDILRVVCVYSSFVLKFPRYLKDLDRSVEKYLYNSFHVERDVCDFSHKFLA
jgi:hypothetical protein